MGGFVPDPLHPKPAIQLSGPIQIARERAHRRNRVVAYDRYLSILSEGTEPL